MKKIFLLAAFFIGTGFCVGSAFAAGQPMLADRHVKAGAKCESCHAAGVGKAQAPDYKTCLQCHGSFQKVAELTGDKEINFHDTHLGDIECTNCHKAHSAGQLMCAECHSGAAFLKSVKVP